MITQEKRQAFYNAMEGELAHAKNVHPDCTWPGDDIIFAVSILNEEAGKLTQAANDARLYSEDVNSKDCDVKKYIARVAAMAQRIWVNIPDPAPKA